MGRFVADQRGGGPVLEWTSAVTLVALLALAFGEIGSAARRRIAGGDTQGAWARTESTPTQGRASNQPLGPTTSTSEKVSSADRSVPPPDAKRTENTDASHEIAGCEDGFWKGADRAFVNGEGEVVGDLLGVRDRDIVAFVYRPTEEVLGDVQRAAPGVMAAAPGVIGTLAGSAWSSAKADPLGAAGSVLNAVFVDSVKTTGQLLGDGWHGGGVLMAAAQRGDCVAFGQTLRSGVNNVPELVLNGSDAMGLAIGAGKLGTRAVRSPTFARLAKAALHQADDIVQAALHQANDVVKTVTHHVSRSGTAATRVARSVASGDIRVLASESSGFARTAMHALGTADLPNGLRVASARLLADWQHRTDDLGSFLGSHGGILGHNDSVALHTALGAVSLAPSRHHLARVSRQRLRALRNGYPTQSAMARATGVSSQTLGELLDEADDQLASVQSAIRLASTTGISTEWWLVLTNRRVRIRDLTDDLRALSHVDRAEIFRDRLAETVRRNGGDIRRFADHTGVPMNTVEQLLLADDMLPSVKTLRAIRETTGVGSDYLVVLTNERPAIWKGIDVAMDGPPLVTRHPTRGVRPPRELPAPDSMVGPGRTREQLAVATRSRVQALVDEHGSIGALAEKTGLSQKVIRDLLDSNKNYLPSTETAIRLARVTDTSLEWWLVMTDTRMPLLDPLPRHLDLSRADRVRESQRRFAELVARHGGTVEAFAERTRLDPKLVEGLLSQVGRLPRPATLRILRERTDIDLDYLLVMTNRRPDAWQADVAPELLEYLLLQRPQLSRPRYRLPPPRPESPTDPASTYANRVDALVREHGSRLSLAHAMGVTTRALLDNGIALPSAETTVSLARFTGVSTHWWLALTDVRSMIPELSIEDLHLTPRELSLEFRRRLAESVARNGGTTTEFAQRAGLNRDTIYSLLSGKKQLPSAATLRAIHQRIGIDLDYLMALTRRRPSAWQGVEVDEEIIRSLLAPKRGRRRFTPASDRQVDAR